MTTIRARRRAVDRSGMPPPIYSERQRRELLAALWLSGGVRLALAAALIVCAVQSFLVFRAPIQGIAPEARYVVPVLLGAGGLGVLLQGMKAVRSARKVRSAPLEPEMDDAPHEDS